MNPLEASELRKSYRTKEVLKGISLEVKEGETMAILGQNGAGKTTAIKIFAGLLLKDEGTLRLFGDDPFRCNDPDSLRRKIGYVGQDSERSAYGRLTVRENLLFFGRLMGMETKAIHQRTEQYAEVFQISGKLDDQFMRLSGGQKQTVIIIRALLHDPKLLFLDEPTKGLDPLGARRIRSFLKSHIRDQGKSLVLTSHIMADVEMLADRIAFLKSGTFALTDTPDNVCAALHYTDIVEIAAGEKSKDVKAYFTVHTDARLLNETEEGRLMFGVSDIMGALNTFEKEIDPKRTMEFSHRKAGLEDAYLGFAREAI